VVAFCEWVKADAIVGNPPFLGGRNLRRDLGDEYTDRVYQGFSDVKGQVDFCVFWFRKAADHLGENGRAGLVATNSISQIQTRKAGLDYVVSKGGFIYDAVSSQEWSGDAAVHVSIVNWTNRKSGIKELFLDNVEVTTISTALKSDTAVDSAVKLTANKNLSFQSCELHNRGFIISEEEAKNWIKSDERSQNVLRPMLDGKALINPYQPKDWVIDLNYLTIEDASDYKEAFQRVKEKVKPDRDQNKRETRRKNWWKFGEPAFKMRKALEPLSRYFSVPKISKYAMFQSVDVLYLPCEANMVIASDDFYVLGIITSIVHRTWVKAQSSTLKGDTRYTNTTCFETFPFPQTPTPKAIATIRTTTQQLHDYRTQQMEKKQWGITKLYNEYFHEPTSQLAKLHAQLDSQVLQAYGWNAKDNLLEKLLELNLELAEREKRGEAIVGAWAVDNPK
jgi:hypothetical protein